MEQKVNEILSENRGYELFDIRYSSHSTLDRSGNKSDYYSALIIFKTPQNVNEQAIPEF
jgi:hypothetical protein